MVSMHWKICMHSMNKIVFNEGIAYICMKLNVHTLSYLCFVDDFDIIRDEGINLNALE